MIDFKSLGFKDITEDKPIRFIECFGVSFDDIYPYSKRFYKQEGNITIELKVGNYRNTFFISGICYHSKGWQKFDVCAPKDYIKEMFIQTLNAVKYNINYGTIYK